MRARPRKRTRGARRSIRGDAPKPSKHLGVVQPAWKESQTTFGRLFLFQRVARDAVGTRPDPTRLTATIALAPNEPEREQVPSTCL